MICALMLSSLLSGLVICSGRFSGGLSGSSHSPLLSIVVMSVSSFLASKSAMKDSFIGERCPCASPGKVDSSSHAATY